MPKAPKKLMEIYTPDPSSPDGFVLEKTIGSHNCNWLMNTRFGKNKSKYYTAWYIKYNGEYHQVPWKAEDAGQFGACNFCDSQLGCLTGTPANLSLKHLANVEALNT